MSTSEARRDGPPVFNGLMFQWALGQAMTPSDRSRSDGSGHSQFGENVVGVFSQCRAPGRDVGRRAPEERGVPRQARSPRNRMVTLDEHADRLSVLVER